MNRQSGCSCSKRSLWISGFLSVLVLAFTSHLLAVVTPSWQYVYLEDGRTEHHHGLWLDCKRDYSNEYGKPREYYESLYRINNLQNPFDQFYLPPLMCVYKFDYWLDDEDWYEHGYDENRLQNDAYQHLFIGWKIAALTGHCFALICALTAIIMLFCGYCHRLLICVSAVLVTLTVISSTAGNAVYYMFASYQDNNIIKEDDGIYEQHFGWSFYASIFGNALYLTASVIGCVGTSSVLSARHIRLVKIEIGGDDGVGGSTHDDQAHLLRLSSADGFQSKSSGLLGGGVSGDQLNYDGGSSSSSRFKRSYSAVYKIDSSALRKWEREAMRNVAKGSSAVRRNSTFQRANSLPNMAKKDIALSREFSRAPSQHSIMKPNKRKRRGSNSQFGGGVCNTAFNANDHLSTTREFIPRLNQPQPQRITDINNELIYDYVDENYASSGGASSYDRNASTAMSNSNGFNFRRKMDIGCKKTNATTAMNTYDIVPMMSTAAKSNQFIRFEQENVEDEYLKPRSSTSASDNNSTVSSFTGGIAVEERGNPKFIDVPTGGKSSTLQQQGGMQLLREELRTTLTNELRTRATRQLKPSAPVKTSVNSVRNRNEVEKPKQYFVEVPVSLPSLTAEPPKPPQRKSIQYMQPLILPDSRSILLERKLQETNADNRPKTDKETKLTPGGVNPTGFLQLNTFQNESSVGTPTSTNGDVGISLRRPFNRSLTNLVTVPDDQSVNVFDRRDSTATDIEILSDTTPPLARSSSHHSMAHYQQDQSKKSHEKNTPQTLTSRFKETNFGFYESEMDRSIGSTSTFVLNSSHHLPFGDDLGGGAGGISPASDMMDNRARSSAGLRSKVGHQFFQRDREERDFRSIGRTIV